MVLFVAMAVGAPCGLAQDGEEYDLIITGAQVVDGTGAAAVAGSVAVRDGRVVAVGAEVNGRAAETIDAGGLVVAPGLIDVHTHSEGIGRNPVAENFLRMGVTTIVTGNCGASRTDVPGFFREIEEAGVWLNVATLVGHGSVRRQGMGGEFIRPPTDAELEKMRGLVRDAMEAGAVGLSTGLIYVPGTFAKTEEIIALADVVAEEGGIYVSHMRHENARIFEALDELVRIAREAGVPAHVSHIKLSGPSAWGQADAVLARLDRARSEGLQITHDQYTYTASSTGIAQTIPDAALAGSGDEFRERLADPATKAEIVREMEEIRTRQGRDDYGYAVIASFRADRRLNGKSIPEAARIVRGGDSVADQVELILDIQSRGGASGVFHGMDEADLTRFMRHPLTMFASDGGPKRPGSDVPHPRSYGNAARVIARYVREQKVLGLEEAVRRMTSLPADTFKLEGRGRIVPGAHADLIVFDPERVADTATFSKPHQYAEGFVHVIVNGVPAIRNGELTGERGGMPVKAAGR